MKKGTVIVKRQDPTWRDESEGQILTESRRLAERLAWERRKAKKTLRDIEAATSISNGYLSQVETGKIEHPSVFTVKKLADYYGVSLDELVSK